MDQKPLYSPAVPSLVRPLLRVASASGKSYVDILLQLGPTGASGAYFVMDEALQAAIHYRSQSNDLQRWRAPNATSKGLWQS